MQISIVPVQVQCIQGMRTMHDLTINGRPIKGARSYTKAEAEQERDKMLRSKVWQNAKAFLE